MYLIGASTEGWRPTHNHDAQLQTTTFALNYDALLSITTQNSGLTLNFDLRPCELYLKYLTGYSAFKPHN